jgi:hypothetical protein
MEAVPHHSTAPDFWPTIRSGRFPGLKRCILIAAIFPGQLERRRQSLLISDARPLDDRWPQRDNGHGSSQQRQTLISFSLTTDGISGRRGCAISTRNGAHCVRKPFEPVRPDRAHAARYALLTLEKTSQRASFVTDQRIAGFAYC